MPRYAISQRLDGSFRSPINLSKPRSTPGRTYFLDLPDDEEEGMDEAVLTPVTKINDNVWEDASGHRWVRIGTGKPTE